MNGTISSQTYEVKPSEVPHSVSQSKNAKHELIMLSLPALGGLAIEPMVQLMETAFIGRLGKVDVLFMYLIHYILTYMFIILTSFSA